SLLLQKSSQRLRMLRPLIRRLHSDVAEACEFYNRSRLTVQGMLEVFGSHFGARTMQVTSERPSPDHSIFRARAQPARSGGRLKSGFLSSVSAARGQGLTLFRDRT